MFVVLYDVGRFLRPGFLSFGSSQTMKLFVLSKAKILNACLGASYRSLCSKRYVASNVAKCVCVYVRT